MGPNIAAASQGLSVRGRSFPLLDLGYPSCLYLGRLPDAKNNDPQKLSYIKELGRKSRKMRWARLQVGNPANRLHLRNSLLITTSSTGLRQQLNVLTSSSFLLNSLKGVMQWLIQRKHFACKTRRLVKRQKTKIMAERQKQNHSKHNRSYSGRRKRYMKDLAMQLDTSYVPVTMACPQSRRSGFSV